MGRGSAVGPPRPRVAPPKAAPAAPVPLVCSGFGPDHSPLTEPRLDRTAGLRPRNARSPARMHSATAAAPIRLFAWVLSTAVAIPLKQNREFRASSDPAHPGRPWRASVAPDPARAVPPNRTARAADAALPRCARAPSLRAARVQPHRPLPFLPRIGVGGDKRSGRICPEENRPRGRGSVGCAGLGELAVSRSCAVPGDAIGRAFSRSGQTGRAESPSYKGDLARLG